MIKYYLTILLISISAYNVCGIAKERYTPKSSGEVVSHSYYTLSYVNHAEQAEWVYYELTPQMINGSAHRRDDFRVDTKLSKGSAELKDYVGSGYDRGHLCPAASMTLNKKSMSESFFMSNMSPQHPSFNRGAWKKLEEQVREWVLLDSLLVVVSGPVLSNDMKTIGANRVAVPNNFYKVIYSPKSDKMIAFIMPNRKITEPIKDYIVTVDSVESVTRIDFFNSLPDTQEESLEGFSNSLIWSFNGESKSSRSVAKESGSVPESKDKSEVITTNSNAITTQCKGVNKSGTRCKNMTKSSNGFCYKHQAQAT